MGRACVRTFLADQRYMGIRHYLWTDRWICYAHGSSNISSVIEAQTGVA